MPRIPTRIQGAPFGTLNLNRTGTNFPRAAPSILQPGPTQTSEQFNGPGITPNVARALNQLQNNIAQATSQAKADPTGNSNLLEQITLTNGGAGGSSPNVITHALGAPYRGYRINTVRGGYVSGHAAIAPSSAQPASAYLLLWTTIVAFGTDPVTADVEVWA